MFPRNRVTHKPYVDKKVNGKFLVVVGDSHMDVGFPGIDVDVRKARNKAYRLMNVQRSITKSKGVSK